MKKTIAAVAVAVGAVLFVAGCSPADNASQNISQSAENFQVTRNLTVINGITDSVIFQAAGTFSYETTEAGGSQNLEVTFKLEDGTFRRHTVGLSDNVTYVVEDLDRTANADAWIYEVFYLPETPVNIELVK